MAKNYYYLIVILCIVYSCGGRVSEDTISTVLPSVVTDEGKTDNGEDGGNKEVVILPSKADSVVMKQKITLQDVYLSQLHVREATQNNDGVDVEKYLKSTGLGKGYSWCAAFVHWCLEQVHIPNKVTAWSPTAENKNNIVYKLREFKQEPQTGDVVTFFYTNLGRIGHTGFFNKKISDVTYESVEGNTNGAGSREGNGVYKKFRSFNSTYSISRWEKTP